MIYDNSQKNSPYKFQRNGSTSRFVKVTAMLFLKVQMDISTLTRKWPMSITTPVTYVDQAIPSTPNIIHYELMLTTQSYSFVMNKDIDNNKDATNNTSDGALL